MPNTDLGSRTEGRRMLWTVRFQKEKQKDQFNQGVG